MNELSIRQMQIASAKDEIRCCNELNQIYGLIDGFLRFSDYFFDGLFADFAVGDRISESQSSVMFVRYKIERAIRKLTGMKELADEQISILKAKIEELVIKS